MSKKMRKNRGTEKEVSLIFKYRGAGFSLKEIAELIDQSRQTVSYHLERMRVAVEEDSIDYVIGEFTDLNKCEFCEERKARLESTAMIGGKTAESYASELRARKKKHERERYITDNDLSIVDYLPYKGDSSDVEYIYEDGNIEFKGHYSPWGAFNDDVLEGVLIDGLNVLTDVHYDKDEDGEETIPITRYSVHSLSFMIDQLEDEGWPVGAYMKEITYLYIRKKLSKEDKQILDKFHKIGKLLLFTEKTWNDPNTWRDIAISNSNIVSNDERLPYFDMNANVCLYEWEGPRLKFIGLPDPKELVFLPHSRDDHVIARGLVDAMLSGGDKFVPISVIHRKMAVEILELDEQELPSGWPLRLKERLGLRGKLWAEQLYNFLDGDIEFDEYKNKVRKGK